ncbi:uncharacterized protein PSFLO_04626 [Pseudozyma flocculosa]|nr:uncharacterized protein PSFLO_04626 [Pseudozyma flocculosa]
MLASLPLGSLLLLLCHLLADRALAVPVLEHRGAVAAAAQPTPVPRRLPTDPTPDDIFAFYAPRHLDDDDEGDAWYESIALDRHRLDDSYAARSPTTPSKRQADQPSVPLASMGPPTFPAEFPSCPKCEADYGKLSSCMGAASVFANSTSIFNNPMAYINVIRCACTDTFQSVFPQCVDCFQHTNQCYYLGTDPQGTGAGSLTSNIRNICGFGSALLGGVATANNNVGTAIPSSPGQYTDVNTVGQGYNDQSTGAIFQSNARSSLPDVYGASWYAAVFGISALAMVMGGWRTVAGL